MDFQDFDRLSIGIIAIDLDARVRYVNPVYAEFLHATPRDLVGRPIREIITHTKLSEVLRTGTIQRGVCQKTEQGYLFGNRVPIVEGGKVVGAFAELVLHSTEELEELYEKLGAMEEQIQYLTKQLLDDSLNKTVPLLFQSPSMQAIFHTIRKVAPLDTTVLITGETGTGKEVIADTLYQCSDRAGHPFVKINCAAIPTELMESELFGYEKGAFTGANAAGKLGKFELADKGVLFLDEISSMPLTMQSKLLRVLQDKEVERVGGTAKKRVDVKIIAATNENLEDQVRQSGFRQDLFYRLNVINIKVPPLRERREDIPLLCKHFLQQDFGRFHREYAPLSPGALRMLEGYHWPGNVRELKNTMERLAIMCEGPRIVSADIAQYTSVRQNNYQAAPLRERLEQTERGILMDTLRRCRGNKSQCAELLGLNRTTLYSKLNKYGLEQF